MKGICGMNFGKAVAEEEIAYHKLAKYREGE